MKLRDVVFRLKALRIEWVATALKTITPEHQDFREISNCMRFDSNITKTGVDVRQVVGEQTLGEWSDLDRVLTPLWESRSICLKVVSTMPNAERGTRDCIECLLPEITKWDWMFIVEGPK